LFPPEESPKVVELPAQRRRAAGEGKRATSKKKTDPNQFSFEFVEMPEPRQPLRHEFDSAHSPYKVAPLAQRAASALFDLGVTAAMAGLYAATLHWFGKWAIGDSLLRREWWPYLAAAPPLIAFAYKLLWCVGRRDPIGVEAMGLRLVSFDGAVPTPGQRMCRLLTGWLGLGGAGIGLGWAIFDQEKLTWHDHASQTFLTPRRGQE
jgi:uncharacterized RDD family membrane protein YckC